MYAQFSIAEVFGLPVPSTMTVEGFADNQHPNIPLLKEYVFRKEPLRDVLSFLRHSAGDGLYVTGPTGCGKTSLVAQVAARLNWPVQSVTCHGRMELGDLMGQFVLTNGNMQFVHGPLAKALRDGHLLILNEIDLMDPSELSGLNDIIEGAPLVIAQNGGEVIRPHPKFRVIATGNSSGQGDQSGLYQGVMRQNLAFMDRFRLLEVGYPDETEEGQLLELTVPKLPEAIRSKMIDVANQIRRLFVGNDPVATLTVTMSTRSLIRWASLTVAFKGSPNPLEYAMDRALTFRASPEQRIAILAIAAAVFGDDWKQS